MDPGTSPDWLGAARRAASGIRHLLADRPTIAERVRETGTRGEGGDRTLVIDEAAEELVFAQLDQLHESGVRFTALSEERGVVDYGSEALIVVIDPIDGSLNAKRGMTHHALSIAVAEGPTMADVVFGFVHDLGTDEEWAAERGAGATLDGERLDPTLGERRNRAGKLELVGIESADPRWMRDSADGLVDVVHRVRALGAIALSLCQVAAARLDGMTTLRGTRAVDAAAGQLIVREAGGHVCFPACAPPLGAPLDLAPRSPVVAARTEQGLRELATVSRRGEAERERRS
jgi:myo-inositol-1(or 4)-monophosphatase